MRSILAFALIFSGAAVAQTPTAEQVLDKFVEASGGKAAMEKVTSVASKGTVDVTFAGVSAAAEFLSKAPDKTYFIIKVDGYGDVRQGFDGKVAWSDSPEAGLRELTGEQAETIKRSAVFNAPLKWRELFTKAELKGKEKVGERDAWAVVLTPAKGKPTTQHFDVETGLMLKVSSPAAGDQGEYTAITEFSDYREVDGVKEPFGMKNTIPAGDLIFKFTEVKHNVPVDDAKFSKH
jgi:outer membrane lipoprotein-sorting protein